MPAFAATLAPSADAPPRLSQALQRQLELCQTLPTIPAVALRIVELGQDPEVELSKLASVITTDPALSAKMLKIANSPFYARRRAVANLRQALMVLGVDAAVSLALTFSLVTGLKGDQYAQIDHKQYWKRSMLSGMAAQALGEIVRVARAEELFLAGLLQDIGVLALSAVQKQDYAKIVHGSGSHQELRERELASLETDHAQVSVWLMGRWGLPAFLQQAVLLSHETEPNAPWGEEGPFTRCVAVSSWIADIWVVEDSDKAIHEASAVAAALLEMPAERFTRVLDSIHARMPELSALYEIEIDDPQRVQMTLEQAKELLLIRSLHISREAARARQQAERMQNRARSLEERSRRDGLTGVFNRATLDEALAREFDNANQHRWPLSVVFVDLDHFKSVNDTYGHQAGDRVLVSLAHYLQRSVRDSDYIARYGGEEFMLVLPGTRSHDAQSLLTRLVQGVAANPFTLEDERTVNATISAGLATHSPQTPFACLEDLVRAADRSLYAAKRAGRNRFVTYELP